jgi:hypothetical protein
MEQVPAASKQPEPVPVVSVNLPAKTATVSPSLNKYMVAISPPKWPIASRSGPHPPHGGMKKHRVHKHHTHKRHTKKRRTHKRRARK